MSDATLELGPCQVKFGTDDSETDLGKTQGGVIVNFSQDAADLMSDQYGSQPEDQVITGHGATIVIPMAKTDAANLATALNQTKKQIGNQEGVKGSSLVGTKRSSKGQSLLLTKYVNGAVSSDENDRMRFPNAAPDGNFSYNFSISDQRILEVTFLAMPDSNDILYFLGDEDAAESGS